MVELHFKHLFKILKEENFTSIGNDWGNWGNSDSYDDFVNNGLNDTNTNNDMAMFNNKDPEDLIHSRMYQNSLLATNHDVTDLAKYNQYDALVGNTMQRQKIKTVHKKQIIASKNEKNNKNVEIKPWDDIGQEVGVYSDENIFGIKKFIGKGVILRRIINAKMIYGYYLIRIKEEDIIVSAHQIFPLQILNNIKKISNIDDKKVKYTPLDKSISDVEKEGKKEVIQDIKDDVKDINQKKEIAKYFDNVDADEIELDYDEAKELGQDFSWDVGSGQVRFTKSVIGRTVYNRVEESFSFKKFLKNQVLNECVGLVKKVQNDIILGINRDKVLMPLYVVKRDFINGVEVAYLEDKKTGWRQMINEFGITLVNTSMIVNRKKALTDVGNEIIGKTFAPGTFRINEKIDKIEKILTCRTLDEVLKLLENKENRIPGHSFVTDGRKVVSIETTMYEKLMVIKEVDLAGDVITNHGLFFKKEGYQPKENHDAYISSITRKKDAEDLLKKTDNLFDVLSNKKYNSTNGNNILRTTPKIFTNASVVLNSTKREINIKLFMDKIEGFCGIENSLPENYDPKIKINIYKVY